jgi:small subunit ribosomal protein S27e
MLVKGQLFIQISIDLIMQLSIFNLESKDRDLLHPTLERERQSHKLKRLVPAANSYFMDVKCGGCNETAVVFSHAQTIVACNNCKNILSKPTGGKCKLTEGSAFKVKA